jgi:hypothetical protein
LALNIMSPEKIMAPRLDRRILSRAKPENLLRLAKFIKVPVKDDCVCQKCNALLIETVVRKLDELG